MKVKVNAVSMPDTDWKRLITLAKDKPVDVRFIELMPIGEGGTRRDAATRSFWKRYAVNFLSFRPMAAYTGRSGGVLQDSGISGKHRTHQCHARKVLQLLQPGTTDFNRIFEDLSLL